MELDDVAFAPDAEDVRDDLDATTNLRLVRPARGSALIRAFVQVPTLRGENVLGPEPLDVDERALPLAVEQVLEGGDREKIFVIKLH